MTSSMAELSYASLISSDWSGRDIDFGDDEGESTGCVCGFGSVCVVESTGSV